MRDDYDQAVGSEVPMQMQIAQANRASAGVQVEQVSGGVNAHLACDRVDARVGFVIT